MAEKIVVGTDGSASASEAVLWAAHEAALHSASLEIVVVLPKWAYASPPGSRHPEISKWQRTQAHRLATEAENLAGTHAPGSTVHSQVLFGDPAQTLAAHSHSGSLLVVGNHGLGAVRGLLLGSVAFKLAGHTGCPLIVTSDPSTDRPWRQIVVGVDGSPDAQSATRFAFEQARLHQAELRAVHAWRLPLPPVPVPALPHQIEADQLAHEAEQLLTRALQPWHHHFPDQPVTPEVTLGHPVQTLVDASKSADLLVVGSRGLGGLTGLVLGSVSHGILHHAHCPVAIVPPSTPDASHTTSINT